MSAQTSQIRAALQKAGPLDSNDLANVLISGGVCSSADAARKAIQRARSAGVIQSTAPTRFDKIYLYYLDEHKGKRYAKAIRKLLPSKPSFNRVYKTLLANRGWITEGQIAKSASCLPNNVTGRPGGRKIVTDVVNELLAIGLIDTLADSDDIYRIGTQFGSPKLSKGAFLFRLSIEQDLLLRVRDWFRDTYLLSYEKHSCRKTLFDATSFNDTYWDVHGPIYLGPSTREKSFRRSSIKENFLLAELLAYRTYSIVDAESTIERCKSILKRWKSVGITPVVVSRSFSTDAWNRLRAVGVGAVLLSEVFGKNVDQLLQSLWNSLQEAEQPVQEQLTKLGETLSIADGTVDEAGLVGNLKGKLFEVLIALAYKVDGYNTLLQKIITGPTDESEYEIDVFAVLGSTCKLIECKGHHAEVLVAVEEVERHFRDRCAAAADPYGWNITENYDDVEAIFITTGYLDEEASEYASKTQKSHGIRCSIIERDGLLSWLATLKEPHLVGTVKKYYGKKLASETE